MDIYSFIEEGCGEDVLRNYSLEQIKHRFDDEWVEDILNRFKDLRKSNTINNKVYLESGIAEAVENKYGIEIVLNSEFEYGAGVPYEDFSISAQVPLAPESPWAWDKHGKKILRKNKSIDIRVDFNTGKISGIKGVKHTIFLGKQFTMKSSPYTYREACAVFLHELGHIWTYYATLPHIYLTQFLVSEFSERFIDIDTREARAIVVKDVEKKFGLEVLEKERLINSDSKNEVSLIMFTSEVGRLKSIFGKNPYDTRNSEAMADQFVVRHGLGRELGTGLRTDGVQYGVIQEGGSWSRAIENTFISLILTPFIPIAAVITLITGDAILRDDYDKPAKRIEVIIQQLRDRYKEAKNKEQKATIAKEIEIMEKLTENDEDVFSILECVYKHVIPWGRGHGRRLHFAQALESLGNNRLTTRAERLRNITG